MRSRTRPSGENGKSLDIELSGMYRAGVPLDQIQHLIGHTSIKTTEIYLGPAD